MTVRYQMFEGLSVSEIHFLPTVWSLRYSSSVNSSRLHRLELKALVETLAGRNVAFLDGVIRHHRTEDGHSRRMVESLIKGTVRSSEGLTSIGFRTRMPGRLLNLRCVARLPYPRRLAPCRQ